MIHLEDFWCSSKLIIRNWFRCNFLINQDTLGQSKDNSELGFNGAPSVMPTSKAWFHTGTNIVNEIVEVFWSLGFYVDTDFIWGTLNVEPPSVKFWQDWRCFFVWYYNTLRIRSGDVQDMQNGLRGEFRNLHEIYLDIIIKGCNKFGQRYLFRTMRPSCLYTWSTLTW